MTQPKSFRSLLGGESGSILDTYGAVEYEFDGYTIKAHTSRGSENGVVLRYGKNITDLTQQETIENTITGICPYWVDSESGTVVTVDGDVVWSEYAENYPYPRTIPVDFSSKFSSKPTKARLLKAAESYITDNDIGVPEVNITLSFIPLWQSEEYSYLSAFENVSLCDTINVEFELLGVSASAKVIKTVYDVLKERYESIEIGSAKTSLASQINDVSTTIAADLSTAESLYQYYVDTIAAKIVGSSGGYVKFSYNASGLPEAILIMSDEDEASAEHIIRMNQNGIAFSKDYGQTYTSAWSIDGEFVADFIATGNLNATLLTAGIIQDANGVNYWNLESGVISLGGGEFSVNAYGHVIASDIYVTGGEIAIGNNFVVTNDGYLTASGANITGEITATEGQIANWTIDDTALYYSSSTFGASGGMYFGEDGLSLGSAFQVTSSGAVTASDLDITGGSITLGQNFSVTSSGAVSASNIDITGGSITLGSTSNTYVSITSSGALTTYNAMLAYCDAVELEIGTATTMVGVLQRMNNAWGNGLYVGAYSGYSLHLSGNTIYLWNDTYMGGNTSSYKLATVGDLSDFVTTSDLSGYATISDLSGYLTTSDLASGISSDIVQTGSSHSIGTDGWMWCSGIYAQCIDGDGYDIRVVGDLVLYDDLIIMVSRTSYTLKAYIQAVVAGTI